MADNLKIYKYCQKCKGTGRIVIDDQPYDPGPSQEVDCPLCEGEGKTLWGIMLEEEIL
jgi:DnaJ-class molecular chaperone